MAWLEPGARRPVLSAAENGGGFPLSRFAFMNGGKSDMSNAIRRAWAALLTLLALAGPVAADEIYFTVNGYSQGLIQGEVTTRGLEGRMRAVAVEHAVHSPYDVTTGTLTGQRVYAPFVITRDRGKASPRLLQAMLTGEQLQEVVVEYWALQRSTSTMKPMQVIKLKNARIVGIEHMAEQIPGSAAGQVRPVEKLTFLYQTFEFTDVESNVTAAGGQTGVL